MLAVKPVGIPAVGQDSGRHGLSVSYTAVLQLMNLYRVRAYRSELKSCQAGCLTVTLESRGRECQETGQC